MKNMFRWMLVPVFCAVLSAGCGKKEEAAEPADLVTVIFNCDGKGRIALAEEGKEPDFSDKDPVYGVTMMVSPGERLTASARADEGWYFIKWRKNGDDFSPAPEITVEAEEDASYDAVFGEGTGEKTDLSSLKTVDDLFRYTEGWDYSLFEGNFIYIFALDDVFYRAIAQVPAETEAEIAALDLDDEFYNDKVNSLIMALEISRIENISAAVPAQEELDALAGKTGADLLDDGWYVAYGYDLEKMQFFMNRGLFSYTVTFDGSLESVDETGDFEEIRPLKVLSVVYDGLGDASDLSVELEAVK